DDGERLQRRLREAALDRALEQPRAGLGRLARGAERPASGDALQHDAAPALAVALAQEPQRRLDPLRVVGGRLGQLGGRERRRRDDEQRLDRPRERVDGVGGDQAERTVLHCNILSWSARETLIGAKGAACASAISPALHSSSSARKATACSTRARPATSASKSNVRRRRSTPRKRSRNWETGGKRS